MELTDHIRNICYRHWIQQQHRVELEKEIYNNVKLLLSKDIDLDL